MPQPSGADGHVYERHRPEETPLYRIVETHYPRFLARLEAEGGAPSVPNAGRKALTLRTVLAQPEPLASTLLARQPGFSLHAATCCEANQRDKLEKLCRYITRPAIANERLA